MVNFGESDNMIKISEKVDKAKTLTTGLVVIFRSLIKEELLQTEHFLSFIIKGFRTIVFIFSVISTTFRLICPPAFFRCLSNSEPTRNFELRSLLNPRVSPVLIPLAITGYKC